MDRDVYGIEDEPTRHLSSGERRRARRGRVATFGLTLVAVLLGVAAGFLWVNQVGWPDLNTDADPLPLVEGAEHQEADGGESEHDETALEASEPAVENSAQESSELSLLPVEGPEVNLGLPVAGESSFVGAGQPAGAATSAARIQEIMAAREPTATPTPVPARNRLDAVVALGGADLWDEDSGVLLGRLPQGVQFAARERSADGLWLLGTTQTGESGWIAMDQLIAFDIRRLAARDVQVVPATPTPQFDQILLPTPTPQTGDSAQAGTGGTGAPSVQWQPLPDSAGGPVDAPVARISLTDARLNVRAGPGSDYAIVTKAHPNERFYVLGRSAQGDWVQLSIPDVMGGFGWATAAYIEISGESAAVPLSDAVSNAPPYLEGAEAERVRRSREAVGQASQPRPLASTVSAAPLSVAPVATRKPEAVAVSARPAGLQGKLAIQTTWGGDIYLYDLATGDLRLLTGGYDPALSPDGTQVAFTRGGGEHGLYLINVDGTNERMIFNDRELFRSPSWSPDGRWIVFERSDEFTDCRDVGRRCPREQQPRPGYPDGIMRQPMLARVDVHGQNYRDLGVLQSARAPDWSDAGVVYASAAGIQLTQDQPPDTVTTEVYFNIQKQYELSPALQPGGETVLFQRREASHWEIYAVNLDGSGLRALTRPEFTLVRRLPANVAPAWSPDGRQIVFLSNRRPNHEAGDWAIWVMDADGGNQRKLPIDLPITYTYVGERILSWSR